MTDTELLQQALDVMLVAIKAGDWKVDGACDPDYVLEALRARLAEPEPEPVAWGIANTRPTEKQPLMMVMLDKPEPSHLVIPLYTAPPQREWQGLTENEIKHLWYEACQTNLELTSQLIVHLARNIEAKLKEKNGF